MTIHRTVHVKQGEMEADIDTAIAPLIQEVWKAGIVTTLSCQENLDGMAWIEFLTTHDAADFLDAVATDYSEELESLYNRIRRGFDPIGTGDFPWWRFSATPWDTSVNEWVAENGDSEEESLAAPHFEFHLGIRFPTDDIPTLVERMRHFNRSERGRSYRRRRGVAETDVSADSCEIL